MMRRFKCNQKRAVSDLYRKRSIYIPTASIPRLRKVTFIIHALQAILYTKQGKGKTILCLTKYHAMKMRPVLNKTPPHEDVFWEWRYSSMHS